MSSPPGTARRSLDWRRLLSVAKPEATLLGIGTAALLVSSIAGLFGPQAIGQFTDALTQPGTDELFRKSIYLLLAVALISGPFSFLRAWLFTLAGERVVRRIRSELYARIMGQEVGFFDGQRTGELLNRLAQDTGLIQSSVTVNVSMAMRFGLEAIGSLVFLFITSWRLTLLMLLVVPFVAVASVVFARTVRSLAKATQDALAEASSVAEETLSNIRTVRSFAREAKETARYGDRVRDAFVLGRRQAVAYGSFQGFLTVAGYCALALVFWYGGSLVRDGQISIGTFTTFLLYTGYLGIDLGALSSLFGDFNKALGASERVFELLDRRPLVLDGAQARPSGVAGRIAFEAVDFAYPTRPDAPVLKGVDLALNPGTVLALVGPSGGGKSTVAQLISRFYDPNAGRITLDGVDLRDLEQSWLREQIGTVAQEPVLFAATIAENIRYGRLGASDAEVEAAASAANAHTFIRDFPEGYQTMVGERGVRLSGGQKQRIAIARALLKDPKVLILDEATSALDAESEHLVQEALERLMVGRTVIIIAHRLSTVKDADAVAVIDGGRVAELGTHDQLMALHGVYAHLVERQFVG